MEGVGEKPPDQPHAELLTYGPSRTCALETVVRDHKIYALLVELQFLMH